jgi:hypothetical protein
MSMMSLVLITELLATETKPVKRLARLGITIIQTGTGKTKFDRCNDKSDIGQGISFRIQQKQTFCVNVFCYILCTHTAFCRDGKKNRIYIKRDARGGDREEIRFNQATAPVSYENYGILPVLFLFFFLHTHVPCKMRKRKRSRKN